MPAALACVVLSQPVQPHTQVDLRSQGRNVDFSNAILTKPFKDRATLPARQLAGEGIVLGQQTDTVTVEVDTWVAPALFGIGVGTHRQLPGRPGIWCCITARTRLLLAWCVPRCVIQCDRIGGGPSARAAVALTASSTYSSRPQSRGRASWRATAAADH